MKRFIGSIFFAAARRLWIVGLIFAALFSVGSSKEARAQSTCPYIVYGAVLTAGQWAQCFEGKQDALGFTPIAPTNIIATPPLTASVLGQNVTLTCPTCVVTTGSTMTGELVTAASAAGGAGINLPPGTAPTSPVNGDLWTTSGGLFARIAGTTIGPFVGAYPNASNSTLGIARCDGVTTNCSAGVITAVGSAATSIAPGTTTIAGSCGAGDVFYNNSAVLGCSPNLTNTAINNVTIGATTQSTGAFTTIFASGTVTINQNVTASPPVTIPGSFVPTLVTIGANGVFSGVQLSAFLNSTASPENLVFSAAEGTAAAPAALQSGDEIGAIVFYGYTGANYPGSSSGGIYMQATQPFSSGIGGTEIVVATTPNNTVTPRVAATFGQDQSLTLVGNLILSNLSSTTQCLHIVANVVTGTGVDCGGSGGSTIVAGSTSATGFTGNDLISVNANKTIDSGVNFGGSFTFTATLTANTAVTFPTSGTLATTSQLASLPLAQVSGGCGGNAWCGFSAALTTTGTGAPTLAFPSSSFTYTFPGASANLDYQVGSFVSGHCLQASGTAGGIADSGGACGGSSGVASVGNASADTTLTIAGTGSGPWTGSVTAKINLANANVWTALQTHSFNAASLPTAITNSIIRAANSDTNISRIVAEGYGAIAALTVARADSTAASPTGVLSGEQIGGFNAYAWGSNAAWNGSIASLRVYAAENISGTAWGSKACIGTTAVTTTTLTDSLCQGNDGGVTVGSPTGGDKGAGTINAAGLYVNGTAIGGGSPGGATTNIQFNLSGVLSGDSGLTYAGSGGVLTLTPAANTAQPLLITGGSTTGSGTAALGIGVVGTLNTTGLVDGAAFFANITNTASANNSLIADVQIGGVSAFSIANKRSSSTISFVTVNSTLTAMSSSTSMFAAIEGGSLAVVGTGGIISASTAGNGSFTGYRQGGTIASPTALGSGNIIVTYQGTGYDGTTNAQGAGMYVTADQAWTSTAHGTRLAFFATADSTTAFNEKMRLQASGGLTIGNGILSTDPGAGALITSAPITPSSGYTVAALPASPPTGSIAYVTDAIACTFLASLTGGGSTFCPVSYNGSAWVGG